MNGSGLWACIALMSETISRTLPAEPGAAAVYSFAECDRDPEPVGVNWTIRMSFAGATSSVEPPTQALVELLGSLDVGDGDDVNLGLQSGYAGVRRPRRSVRVRGPCLAPEGPAQPICGPLESANLPAQQDTKRCH